VGLVPGVKYFRAARATQCIGPMHAEARVTGCKSATSQASASLAPFVGRYAAVCSGTFY
jgi:hypothetical protein